MLLHSEPFPLTAKLIAGSPEEPGVYALWLEGAVIFIGHARGGGTTIRSCLVDHFSGVSGACTRRASHYTWEISHTPGEREAELLREHAARFGRLPRCNAA